MHKLLPLLGAAMVASPLAAQTAPARPVVQPEETILRVKGEGVVTATPTQMTATIGMETVAATAATALDANNRRLGPVVEMLRAQGIAASDIQTSGLEVQPQYSDQRDRREERIIGFRASNRLTVTSRDLERAGELISALFNAGVNSIDGPYFAVAEGAKEPLTREAEADALREAQAQAESTAAALGMRISRVLLVSDSEVEFQNGSGYIVVTGSRLARTPIEPGQIEIKAEYDVEYAAIPM
ncbi:SIMPL domain-containing protein [Erythrobacter rubeus]|uniref:SIMPL domain-containing protein n=1 Tax=Erythrobacter rubeus TaxID=2760803 RepID=A0ABR8KR81_9SPHN|nr:SIMPL domain-containing protein [Erythrobacter rubeus]MBD2841578.1 SIMPL domain-containing protein [Erythrobacter rubeus]